jgi:Holliday junction resolvasome RuvABC DNA-binding subunit
MKKQILKPIDMDLNLLYQCSDPNCNSKHWLHIREAKTKNFKIVCECGIIYIVKQIDRILVKYNKKKSSIDNAQSSQTQQDAKKIELSVDILESCAKILIGYGFTKTEAISLITKTYAKHNTSDVSLLIKLSLSSLEMNNV